MDVGPAARSRATEHVRPADRARDEVGAETAAGTDRAPRHRGSVRQGADPAARGPAPAVFVPAVIGAGHARGWLAVTGDAGDAFSAAVACSHRLRALRPRARHAHGAHGGHGRAQLGILIKGPEVLEETRRIGTIVLDKTGTVTEAAWSSSTCGR